MNPQRAQLVRRLTAVAVVVSVVACVLPAVGPLVARLSGRFAEFRWSWLAAAFALTLVYWPVNAYVWNMVLKALGHSLPAGAAVRIWLAAQTCRWLPGGVWHYGSRTLQAVSHGIPSTVAVASMALELLLTLAAWLVVGMAGLVWYGNQRLQMEEFLSGRMMGVALASTLALVVMGAAVLFSKKWFPQKHQALRERFQSLRLVRPHALRTWSCFLAYVVLAVLNGIAFYAVILSVSPAGNVPLLAALSANALAWIAGLLAVMAPGGLVVREAALVLQLSLWMPPTEAVLVAVLWRLLQLAVELVCVAAAYAPQSIAARLSRRRPRPKDSAWASPAALETTQPHTH